MSSDDFIRPRQNHLVLTIGFWLRTFSPFRIAILACSAFFFWGAFKNEDALHAVLLLLPLIVVLFFGDLLLRTVLQHPKDGWMIWFVQILLLAGGWIFLLSLEA